MTDWFSDHPVIKRFQGPDVDKLSQILVNSICKMVEKEIFEAQVGSTKQTEEEDEVDNGCFWNHILLYCLLYTVLVYTVYWMWDSVCC